MIKPIQDKDKKSLIGRTLLKTYPSPDGEDERHFVKDIHKLSIYGMPFLIESLPFQTQDLAVGACASTACWMCQYPLSQMFGIEKNSLYEVTSKSVTFPNAQSDRNFPSEGLSLIQIKNYFNTIGLESESIKFDSNPDLTSDMVSVAVRAYLNMNLPIIAALELQKNSGRNDYHAVVITGYRYSQGKITELYVHDDQIGPYSRVTPKNYSFTDSFTSWKNEWTSKRNYNEVILLSLIIPIYPKVRMKFGKIYSTYLEAKESLPNYLEQYDNQVEPEILLYTLNKYKKEIWNDKFENKKEILMKPFPKYMWIIRYKDNRYPYLDIIYDATMVCPSEKFSIIKYIRE
ncbi:MAG: C39 family peptidase [Euryarchaeota archaeon]|nr:C39 family peptidase [Euryarchaeota archaeon]